MRKLTGYIGAMVIVIALMGSILAGYALNINGTTAVMNEYEKVTDVSGLYTHSQEPSYIDYNPASNYIGYNLDTDYYDNSTGTREFRKITGNSVIDYRGSDGHILIDGVDQGEISGAGRFCFISDKCYVYKESNGLTLYRYDGNSIVTSLNNNATFAITNGETITVSMGGNSYTISNNNIILVVATENTDYYCNISNVESNVYINDEKDIIFNGYSGKWGNVWDGTWRGMDTYNGQTEPIDLINNISTVEPDIYSCDLGGDSDGFYTWAIFYPKSVNNGYGIGINYTESNRVNNYLMETTYTGGSTQIVTQTLNLSPGMGLTDHWGYGGSLGQVPRMWRANSMPYDYNGTSAYIGMPTYTTQSTGGYTDNLRCYDIFDIFSYYNISADKQITIKSYGIADYTLDNGESIGDNNFTKLTTGTFYGSPGFMDDKWYCIYNPDTQLFDFYDKNDVKVGTSSTCYVSFSGNSPRYGPITNYAGTILGYYDFGTRPTPHIDISYITQTGGTTTYHYSDITKGYSIKENNVTNVVWNNEYNNGNIQILFRANDTIGTYHNDVIVGDNNISVDYTGGGYYITLNNGDPVNIGKWRNIILDINMINGELSAIPVRTFNSFTNVETDNTNIFIGDLINPTPANIIEWVPTTNSLMFNIYSTSVFMDTYGVVMVNPTLNITDYFTNLDNFYQLKISNIAVVGQSMTVNGITGDVTGNTITFNDETIQIKDLTITYADGHAYISDSHISIDLGEITDNNISMSGAWYFITDLMRGYTTQKMIYEWDWQDFILDNVQFCVIYIGLALIGLLIARRYCTLTITDYAIFMVSIIIALTVQVVA